MAERPAIPRQARRSPTWDASLEAGCRSARRPAAAGDDAGHRADPDVRARPARDSAGEPATAPVARLVQPGKHGGWIGSSLNWAKLDSYGYHPHHTRPAAPAAAGAARPLPGAGRPQPYYYSSYGEDRSIELSAVESSRLWPLLDEAEKAGLQLVYGRKLGALERYREAELCLDVTRAEAGGALAVTPAIRVDAPGGEATVVPLRFIGTEGHGVVYLDRRRGAADRRPGRLALPPGQAQAGPFPRGCRRWRWAGQRLEVPAAGETRFRDEFYPRLRQMAAVISSDGSFTPPAISDPTLVLRASYGDGHDVLARLGVGVPGRRVALPGRAAPSPPAMPGTATWRPSRRSWTRLRLGGTAREDTGPASCPARRPGHRCASPPSCCRC